MLAIGILCAIGSAFFNGSYTSLFKTEGMARLDIHPITFQLYVCGGIFVSSWFVIPFFGYNDAIVDTGTTVDHFQFSGAGMIAGALFVIAASASFLAVQDIGVALAQGIWGGGAMLVSYLWGTLVFREYPARPVLSIGGLFLLLVGVVVVAFCENIGERIKQGNNVESSPLLPNRNREASTSSLRQHVRGVLWACTVGLSGGSVLVPMHYVSPEKQGLIFLPSFGIGSLILSPLVYGLYSYRAGQAPDLHLQEALLTGLLSGMIWNIGNLLSIVAIPIVTYGVAYPIMQCAILVSGMWGIYAFGEINDRTRIAVFWAGGFLLVLGGLALAVAK